MHNEGARVKAFAPFFIKNMAIQFRIYKNNGYIIAARYDTTTSQYTDQTPVNIPAQYLAINIIKADPTDLIAFSCVAYEKPHRELARLPYSEIYDENGVLYSGSDVAAVRDSLTAALNAGGGGGGGDATAANQLLQLSEAQDQTTIQGSTLPSIRLSNLDTAAATTQLATNQINGNQITLDYVLAASMGLIAGVSVIQKSAYNPDVDIITAPAFQIVAAGGGFPYAGFVAADGNVQVVSSNAGDVGNIYVQYLADANSTAYQEGVIPVNGTTAQNSTFKAYRIHTAYYKPTNGNIYNLGTITIRQQATPTNIFAIMLPYTSQTNTGVYTVPAGKEVEILAASCTIGNATGGASSFIKTAIVHKSTTETSFRGRRPIQTSFGMQYTDPPTVVLRLPEKTDIMFVVTSANTNNTEVTFSATIIQKSITP